MEHHPYEQHEEGDLKKVEAEHDGADGSFKNEHHKRSKAAMEHSDEQHKEDGSMEVEAELDGADGSLKNKSQIQSRVWDEFEPIFLNDKVQFAQCLSCHFLFSCKGDSCLRRHLETCPAKPEAVERPQKDSCFTDGSSSSGATGRPVQGVADHLSLPASDVPNLKKKQKTSSMNTGDDTSASKFGQESPYQDVAKMIICHGYPLSIVEHEEMKRIFKSINPVASVSRSDMEDHLLDLFQKEKMNVKDKIALTSRHVSLSASIWTDDGPEPTVKYLCLTAHFIGEDWKVHRRIIKFGMYWCSPTNLERTIHCKEACVPQSESGSYNVIWDAIRDWNLDQKILSFTSVGEIKNDANTARLKAMLMEKRCLPIRGKLCNIACLDDMINSVVAEGQSDILLLIGDAVMDFFVAHASSPLAQQQLLEAISQMSLKCPQEDAKWWHKFYFRLEVLLQFKKLFPAEEVLSPEDMGVIVSICKILRTFYHAIEVISGPSSPTGKHIL
ncbi:zinc finger BED domain-containing protein RICESLEEPER 1-like [Triticum aestivum]|uniref:zinc finger BED domain-containing protein RICESLEEPER 1-like n=1 Tax=Triticum aestivum TaxID=4565 RepID=UPI001D007EB6|nr:zinc finger BED domain-containing protein RICESLEEPER 1-like [Triticum aestivum]